MGIIEKLDVSYTDGNFLKHLKEVIENTKFNIVKKRILLSVFKKPTNCRIKKAELEKYALDKDLYELRIILCLKYGRSSIYHAIHPKMGKNWQMLEKTLKKIKYDSSQKQKNIIKNIKFPRILNIMLSLIWEKASMKVREEIIDHYKLKPEHMCLELNKNLYASASYFKKHYPYYKKHFQRDLKNLELIPTSFYKKHFNYFKNKYLKIKNYREYYFAPTIFKKDDEVLEVFFNNVEKAANEWRQEPHYTLAADTMENQNYLQANRAYWLLKILYNFSGFQTLFLSNDSGHKISFYNNSYQRSKYYNDYKDYKISFDNNIFFEQFMTKQKILNKIKKSIYDLQNLIAYKCIYNEKKGGVPPWWYEYFPEDLGTIITDLFCCYYDKGILINEIPDAVFCKYTNSSKFKFWNKAEAFDQGRLRLLKIKDLAICNKFSINTLSYMAQAPTNPFFGATLMSLIKDKQSTKLIS